MKVDLSVALWE